MKKVKAVLLMSLIPLSLLLLTLLSLADTARARETEGTDSTVSKMPTPHKDALDTAITYITQNKTRLGLTAADTAEMTVTDQYTSQPDGVTHIYLAQQWQGIKVYNGILNIHITPDGTILHLGSRFVPHLSQAINTTVPTLSAVDAVKTAAAHLHLTPTAPFVIQENIGGPAQEVWLSTGGISQENIPVKLVYQPHPDHTAARLAWAIAIYQPNGRHWWQLRIDAVTGQVLAQDDWVQQLAPPEQQPDPAPFTPARSSLTPTQSQTPDDYFVYPWPVESPNHTSPLPPADARVLQTDPATDASPFGWHDTDGVPGHESQFTIGNNVDVYEDTDATNSPTGGDAARADGGPTLFFSHTLDLTQAPINYVDASLTNLFYWSNTIHDVWHGYGFDEPAGNFQENNYGQGGLGGDRFIIEAQDGAGTCGATVATPPDGSSPRMQLLICGIASPPRDGALDSFVITYEYTLGSANRLTGGPSTVSCLQNAEQMGVGWGDWFAMMMTIEPGDAGADARTVGTYFFGQPPDGPGIRPIPYSTDFSVNDYTYGDLPVQTIPHGVGFIWATMLWELNWELIDVYGFDPNIYADGTGGNNLAMKLVSDGLKLQPCSPGFVDGRDAILAADLINTGGANQCTIWTAFARRGLGVSASQGSSSSTSDGTEAFDLPAACLFTLNINKFANPPVVTPGDTLTYTLVVANETSAPLTNVVISDVVPISTTYVLGSASDGGSESGGVVTWPGVTLNGGDIITRTFLVTVDGQIAAGQPGSCPGRACAAGPFISNTACVRANEGNSDCDTVLTPVFDNPEPPTVVITPDSAANGDPGSSVTYTLWLTNTGMVTDVITLTVSGNSWPTTLSDSSVLLNPGEGVSLTADTAIPAGALAGAVDVATITAVSSSDPNQVDTVTLTTTALAIYGVVLSPDQALTGTVGSMVTYTAAITNTGNITESFTFTASGGSWPLNYPPSVTLAAHANTAVSIQVTIPVSAAQGTMDVTTVTATAMSDPGQSDALTLRTTAVITTPPPTYGALLSPAHALTGTAGSPVTYSVWLTNIGTVSDTFDLVMSGYTWPITPTTATLTLAAGQYRSIIVMVGIPAEAEAGAMDTALLTATSQGDPTASDTTTFTTTAVLPPQPMPMIYLPFITR